MRKLFTLSAVMSVVVLTVVSCRRTSERPASAIAPPPAPPPAAAAPSSGVIVLQHPETLDGVQFLRALKGGGEEPATQFKAGDTLLVRVKAKEVPKGVVGQIDIKDAAGKKIVHKQESFPETTRTITFRIPTAKWSPGKYVATIYWGDNIANQSAFVIQ